MIVHDDIKQGSEAWEQIRLGRATASQASNILTPTGKLSTSRIKYARKLARECRVSDPMVFSGNKFTDWGHEHEDEARKLFESMMGYEVTEVGFVTRDDKIIGCSPDGLIMDKDGRYDMGLEIKCPQVDKHTEYLMEGVLPKEYKLQVHWSMAVTGIKTWWFMSYFPETNPLIIKVQADEFTELVSRAQDDFIPEYREVAEQVKEALFGKVVVR
jgi:putative phage-type endonuclease